MSYIQEKVQHIEEMVEELCDNTVTVYGVKESCGYCGYKCILLKR